MYIRTDISRKWSENVQLLFPPLYIHVYVRASTIRTCVRIRIHMYLHFLLPGADLPLELLHESDEPDCLRSGRCVHGIVLQVHATLGDGGVELLHVLAQQPAKAREDLPVPRVVLQIHFRLHLKIINRQEVSVRIISHNSMLKKNKKNYTSI